MRRPRDRSRAGPRRRPGRRNRPGRRSRRRGAAAGGGEAGPARRAGGREPPTAARQRERGKRPSRRWQRSSGPRLGEGPHGGAKTRGGRSPARAGRSEKDAAQRFALLNRARLTAVAAGDLAAARRVADEMVAQFVIDAWKANVAVLEGVAETASNDQCAAVAEFALVLLDEALAADRFEPAERLHEIGLRAARKANDRELQQRLAQRAKPVAMAGSARDRGGLPRHARRGTCKCRGQPGFGRVLLPCQTRLGQGASAPGPGQRCRNLKAAAQKGLGPARRRRAAHGTGDRWWDLAQGTDGEAEESLRLRALRWYQEAVVNLGGLNHARIENRLQQYEKLLNEAAEGEAAAAAAQPAGRGEARPVHGPRVTHE